MWRDRAGIATVHVERSTGFAGKPEALFQTLRGFAGCHEGLAVLPPDLVSSLYSLALSVRALDR